MKQRFPICYIPSLIGVWLAVACDTCASAAEPLRLAWGDERLGIHGLAWWHEDKPTVARLPVRSKASFPPRVWTGAQSPAGVRIRFATDARTVRLTASGTTLQPPPHVTGITNGGVDLYVDNIYRGSAAPDRAGKLGKEWELGREQARREITFYLPVARPLAIQEVVLDPRAAIWPARKPAVSKPLVFYGSSITQGSAASNPGVTYIALLSRWLDFDFVNLGFAGNGLGEPALAEAMAEIDAACYVVDFWANPTTDIYRENLPRFLDILRAKHPHTPILVTSPYYNPSEDVPGETGRRQIEKRAFTREHVLARIAKGDTKLLHVDGLEMLSREQADGLADGRHANSMGFYFCARGLEPHLRTALQLAPRVEGLRP